MEPNEFRLMVNEVEVGDPSHDRSARVRLARAFIAEGKMRVVLEGRTVSPWRDVEIPYPPDNKEDQT